MRTPEQWAQLASYVHEDCTSELCPDLANLAMRFASAMAEAESRGRERGIEEVRQALIRSHYDSVDGPHLGCKECEPLAMLMATAAIAAPLPGAPEQPPIDMVLRCPNPKCGLQHVDAPEPGTDWTNPPHRSHKCHGCGTVWRPADVPTNGVAAIATRGTADTWPPTETSK